MVAECHGGGGGDFLIKLFGKTIPVPEPESGDAKDLQQSSSSSSTEQDQDVHAPENAAAHPDTSDASPQPEVVDAEDPKSSPETHQNTGDGDGDAASQREKLRKPDKVLPCPRCNSMDTKFCYFNNYNVNQPRHFCKNCQRYWTAGGAMRNVPVGAGRRKNKNAVAASHFFQSVRDALPAAYGGDTLIKTTNNGTVLSFGHGGAPPAPAPACLDLAEHLNRLAPVRNRNTGAGADTGPCSEGSTNSNRDDKSCVDEQPSAANGGDGSLHLQQQHPATATMNVWTPYSCAPPPAAYFSSGIAIPIYPAAPGYWGCMVPGAWSLPWAVQQPPPPPSSSSSPTTTTTSSSGAAESHTLGLGKHPRDRNREGDDDGRSGSGSAHGNNGAPKVWAPKTIRIDDVDEVARSSIWSLIGIRGDKTKQQQVDAGGHRQLGMVFEPKREATTKKAMMTSSPLLHANPVALTRSVAFQEGS